jgi:hypothetical protein
MFDLGTIVVAGHVLFAGLWLGVDIGTYLSFRVVVDRSNAVEARVVMARYFALVNMGPRTALIVTFGLGLLASVLRLDAFSNDVWRVVWLVAFVMSIAWLVVEWMLFWLRHPQQGDRRTSSQVNLGRRLAVADTAIRIAAGVLLVAAGLFTLVTDGPTPLAVFGWKMLLFAGVVGIGWWLLEMLPQVTAAMQEIFIKGSSDQREYKLQSLARPMSLLIFGTWGLLVTIIWISVAYIP